MGAERTCFIVFIVLLYHDTTAVSSSETKFVSREEMKDLIPTTTALLVTKAPSEISCCRWCHSNPQCKSFFWGITENTCHLQSTVYLSSDGLLQQDGVIYYVEDLEELCFTAEYTWASHVHLCYKLYEDAPVPHSVAFQTCEDLGHRLIRVTNAKMNEYLKAVVKNMSEEINQVWIAGTDINLDNDWTFNDGTQMRFFDWSSGEPTLQDKEYCINIDEFRNFTWNNIPCGLGRKFICEMV